MLVSDERHCGAYQITVLCVLGVGWGDRPALGPAQWIPADFTSVVRRTGCEADYC